MDQKREKKNLKNKNVDVNVMTSESIESFISD